MQAVMSQASFYSSKGLTLHYGLGETRAASLKIRWPAGKVQEIAEGPVNRLIEITEP